MKLFALQQITVQTDQATGDREPGYKSNSGYPRDSKKLQVPWDFCFN